MATIYFFIVIGYISKKSFKEQLDQKTLILLNLYFLQPILIFWGLTRAPINFDFMLSPAIYFVIVFIVLALTLLVVKPLFKDKSDRSIYLAAATVGNTGNLGIPLGIALFGEQSVPYTSIINIANVLFIYTFSVYFFAKDKFDFKSSIISIFKIPAIWFAVVALLMNYLHINFNADINRVLEMGAYTAIVLQLVIFGIYLSEIRMSTINWKLSLNIVLIKHIVLPAVGLGIILLSDLNPYVGAILFMELMVPLAVNNVNLAALYNCKPHDTTSAILLTSITFITLIYFYLEIIHYFFGV